VIRLCTLCFERSERQIRQHSRCPTRL